MFVDMDYTVSGGALKLVVRRHGGGVEVVDSPIRPYFFVPASKVRVARFYVDRIARGAVFSECGLKTISGESVVKVECQYPKLVGMVRRAMPSGVALEADIPFERRVRFDVGWRTSDTYNVAYFDLETATVSFDGFREGEVIGASIIGDGFSECVVGGEGDVLRFLSGQINQHGVELLVGYNSDRFDVPLILDRFPRYGLSARGLRFLDLYQLIRRNTQRMLSSWSLSYVSEVLLGERRVNADRPVHRLSRSEIRDRCMRDSELLYELESRYGYVDTAITKGYYSNLFPDETIYASRVVDAILLQKARSMGYVLPSKPETDIAVKHSGAYILQPPEALKVYSNVLVLDVTSMYPNIIMQFSLSPDVEHKLIPTVLRELYDERVRLKALAKKGDVRANVKQNALKVILNATYGVMSNPNFRLYDPELGDRVATYGREINSVMRNLCSELGLEVVASDTDSVFVVVGGLDVDGFEALARLIELEVRSRLGVSMSVEPDKLYSRLYFPRAMSGDRASKKKYAGLVVWGRGRGWHSPELEVVGLESVRSDWPDAIKLLQKVAVTMYLYGYVDGIRGLVSEFTDALRSGSIPLEYLALSKSITKSDYKVKPPHIVAADIARGRGVTYVLGDKVRYVYTYRGVMPLLDSEVDPRSIDVDYYSGLAYNVLERSVGIGRNLSIDDYLTKR